MSSEDIVNDFFPKNDRGAGVTMAGQADLILISQLININLNTLKTMSHRSDFPNPTMFLSGIRLYDVSSVARYMQVPIRERR